MIYLDHHAATPLSARVQGAIAEAHRGAWANPASVHGRGRDARASLERSRRALAAALGVQAADLVFTAGGTEACNLGVLGPIRDAGRHVVSSGLEHPAVQAALAQRTDAITWLPLREGPPTESELANAIRPDTALVALQWVNHETGSISPVEAYARVCRERAVPLFVDACQALGKVAVDLGALGASAVAVAASKFGGPAGTAALWVERGLALAARAHGGAQERGRRAGTPDVAALAGLAAALEELPNRLAAMPRIAAQRDRLEQACVALGGVVNGAGPRVATVTNLSFAGWRSEILVAALDLEGLCASAGAACSSGVASASPVLLALYPDQPWRASSALRLSLGPETTDDDVERAIAVLQKVLGRGP